MQATTKAAALTLDPTVAKVRSAPLMFGVMLTRAVGDDWDELERKAAKGASILGLLV